MKQCEKQLLFYSCTLTLLINVYTYSVFNLTLSWRVSSIWPINLFTTTNNSQSKSIVFVRELKNDYNSKWLGKNHTHKLRWMRFIQVCDIMNTAKYTYCLPPTTSPLARLVSVLLRTIMTIVCDDSANSIHKNEIKQRGHTGKSRSY